MTPTKKKAKCPHLKADAIVGLQVSKLGPWDGRGPWVLMVNVFGGGAYSLGEGTKIEMCRLASRVRRHLRGKWEPAQTVVKIAKEVLFDEAGAGS